MAKSERMSILKDEINEILKYKWIESEKAGYDIGSNRACLEWRDKYAKSYREWWDEQHRKRDGAS